MEIVASIVPSRIHCNYSTYTSLSAVSQYIPSGTLRTKQVYTTDDNSYISH